LRDRYKVHITKHAMLQTTTLTLVAHQGHLTEPVQALISYAGGCKIWVFKGDLGAGKTTLIKAICKELGVQEHVTSPTFSLINEYSSDTGDLIYHMDAYRLDKDEDIVELDYLFYLHTHAYCFIEWPEKIIPLIQQPYLEIQLHALTMEARQIVATMIDSTL
jgi:tRNA threonylcarbamoyladenosine biosynthesis protein TsaE